MQTVTFTLELSTCFLFLQIFLTFCGHGVYSTIKYIDITHFPFCWLADVIKYYHDSWLSTFCKVCSETKNKLLSIKKMNRHTTHKSNGFTWWTRNILCFFCIKFTSLWQIILFICLADMTEYDYEFFCGVELIMTIYCTFRTYTVHHIIQEKRPGQPCY